MTLTCISLVTCSEKQNSVGYNFIPIIRTLFGIGSAC